MSVILFLFAAYGLCFGIMNDKIPFLPLLRKIPLLPDLEGKTFFNRMFDCPYCTGYHTGWILWCVFALPGHLQANTDPLIMAGELPVYAFAASAFCYAVDALVLLVEKKTP